MTKTGIRMHSSRGVVFANNAEQFQSYDGSTYYTVLRENDYTDTVSSQLRDSCYYQISAHSEVISTEIHRQLCHV